MQRKFAYEANFPMNGINYFSNFEKDSEGLKKTIKHSERTSVVCEKIIELFAKIQKKVREPFE